MKVQLTDAYELAKSHPKTFQRPEDYELRALKKGDFVKVCCVRERFWVELTQDISTRGCLIGNISNDLVLTDEHGLMDKDTLVFHKRNVYSIHGK